MRRWVAVICLALSIIAGLCCYWLVVRSHTVSRALSAQMQRGPGATIDFAEVAPFAWDRVYIFGPYTPHEQIHASLGFRWEEVATTTIEWNDGVNLVVFVRGGEVVHWFEHARREELGQLADPRGHSRDQARFTVRRVGAEQRLALALPER